MSKMTIADALRGAARKLFTGPHPQMPKREHDLWTLLEEVQARVDLPDDLDRRVTNILWGERSRDDE